ncbi:uncharacterized protein LOC118745760 [Rhagoletis pomonella]|uniref:uncharacterized protein LOC118745760 n=1 Tax=Rhagoletis pomonella TaxID=28610 RepID=UPI001786267E|nr:uncharacterized protein LOC118745760 [Rhagoletis pomonella]
MNTWVKIKGKLPLLNKIRTPRRILCNEPANIELHGFCDVSMKAYGAVVYARSENKTDSTILFNWLELDNGRHLRHICSKDNPADIISRGVSPSELINNNL